MDEDWQVKFGKPGEWIDCLYPNKHVLSICSSEMFTTLKPYQAAGSPPKEYIINMKVV